MFEQEDHYSHDNYILSGKKEVDRYKFYDIFKAIKEWRFNIRTPGEERNEIP